MAFPNLSLIMRIFQRYEVCIRKLNKFEISDYSVMMEDLPKNFCVITDSLRHHPSAGVFQGELNKFSVEVSGSFTS